MTTEQMAEWLDRFLELEDTGGDIAARDLVVLEAIAERLHELGAAASSPAAAAPDGVEAGS